jgi:ribosome maturation factor RimP
LSKIEDKIEKLVTEPINNLGYEVYDVIYAKEGKDNYLKIFIDKDTGISLDDCEKVNNEITDLLDEANYINDSYFLEISSPGIERHIRKDKHLEKSLGEEIDIKLFTPIDKQKEIIGILKQFDKDTLTIEKEEKKELIIQRNNISLIKRAFKW